MGRGKNNVKQIKKTIGDPDEIMNMFSQLTGDMSKLDPNIVMDKYQKMKHNIMLCNKVIGLFNQNIMQTLLTINIDVILFETQIEDIDKFIKMSQDSIVEEATLENVVVIYSHLKESHIIDQYLELCKNLMQCSKSIGDKYKLNDEFIRQHTNSELQIFPFSEVNFKLLFDVYLEELSKNKEENEEELRQSKIYVLSMLNILLISTQDIYKLITTPDVDIDKISEVIINAINSAETAIPGCAKAFKMISKSFDMLKTNMTDYYKDFISTKDPTIIFQNFILDVSKGPAINTRLLFQFRKIINFYRQQSSSRPKDPKLEAIFEKVNQVMSAMDNSI